MKASYKFIFARKGKREGVGLIELRIYVNKKNHYISTGIRVHESQWDAKRSAVKNHDLEADYNIRLHDLRNRIEKRELKLLEKDRIVTFQKLKEAIREGSSDDTFIGFVQNCLETDPDYPAKKHHYSLLNRLKVFGKIIDFGDLTVQNIERFDRFLRGHSIKDKNGREHPPIQAQSTIHSYHRRLKTYINRAIRYRYLKMDDNPYNFFKSDKGETGKIRYLSKEELDLLREKHLPIERLDRIRDMFVFCCYTGLPYQEAERATRENIKIYDGQKWLEGQRGKTGMWYQVPLLKEAERIVEKYAPFTDRLLPMISNQHTNAYLKEIQSLCGIEQNLTFHMARHTFATTVTLENGIPLETVSKMLGHSSIKTTQIYAKVRREKIKKDMDRLT